MHDSGSQLVVDDFESMAPVVLTPHRGPMSDEEFIAFCEKYEDCIVEVDADGEIVIMPPGYSNTGNRASEINGQLWLWAKSDGRGKPYDSEGGFRLPNGARRSPDACWVRKERIAALPGPQQDAFFNLCPDFVIELRSAHDRMKRLQAKMTEYIENGAELGWLIDPIEKWVWIYRPGPEPEVLENPTRVEGEGPVAGFTLDLAGIID